MNAYKLTYVFSNNSYDLGLFGQTEQPHRQRSTQWRQLIVQVLLSQNVGRRQIPFILEVYLHLHVYILYERYTDY